MNWDMIFGAANLFALIAWALLILGPRGESVFAILREGAVGLLCLAYASLLILILFVVPEAGSGEADFSSLAGVQAIFASEGGATIGWIHYLAFDLFVGLWIAKKADDIRLARWVQAPILIACFMMGPFGLLIFFIVRRLHRQPQSA